MFGLIPMSRKTATTQRINSGGTQDGIQLCEYRTKGGKNTVFKHLVAHHNAVKIKEQHHMSLDFTADVERKPKRGQGTNAGRGTEASLTHLPFRKGQDPHERQKFAKHDFVLTARKEDEPR